MNPLIFGSSPRALYGVYHPPAGKAPLGRGVVLCPPFGQEYMRAHRAFRQLAMMLARRGFHVFRFDYYGTGDSAGDGDEATVEQWIEDVGTAIDELKDTAGLDRVSLVGLRLGAALAVEAARRRDDVEALALWTPVVDGARYVEELFATRAEAGGPKRLGGIVNVLGFPVTPALEAGLRAIDLSRATDVKARAACIVDGEGAAAAERQQQVVEALRAAGLRAERRALPSRGNWAEVDTWGSALIPHALIQGVVDYLAEGRSER